MAINVDHLQAGLVDYLEGLEKHSTSLRQDYEELAPLWAALGAAYGGSEAEDMLADWRRTSEWFEEYIRNTAVLCEHLESRIKHLNTL